MREMLLPGERPERLQYKSTCRWIKDLVGWGGGCGAPTHLGHLKDALRVQTAAADLPRAGDSALVCDGHDEAGHRARLFLQGRIHYVPVSHLQSIMAGVSQSRMCAALLSSRKGLTPAHLAQRHDTGNVFHVQSQAVIRVIRQLDFLPSFFVGWYMNSGNSNRGDDPISLNFSDSNTIETQQNY